MSKQPDYTMLYCDGGRCFVNTFEYGYTGNCPGVVSEGRKSSDDY